ncbi:pentapeptide repeat-containing protein [Kribbella sp. NPDC003505]|uniref:pentapeptide repeat-containing protein n=1 Tax=Kribbella sp. NPDC003505 TaxID=3154448 RepID=UPI0033BF6544
MAVVLAAAGAVGLYFVLAWLVRIDARPETATPEQQKLLADLVKIALGLAAGIGAAVALIVGYRRARVDESASFRDDRRLFSSRYQDAADLIGHEQAAVRLAGIYAMARLADDWEEQRQQCIDVLCAYLRLPYEPDTSEPRPQASVKRRRAQVVAAGKGARHGEREVRHTVIRLINQHLQPERDTPPKPPPGWHRHYFDFTGSVFDGGDFGGAEFSGSSVSFRGARFSGGTVNFGDAAFIGGNIDFGGAEFFDGTVNFSGAWFAGAKVDFGGAGFSGGTVNFAARFADGTVDFVGARFAGGTVDFGYAEFSGGTVNFGYAEFAGGTVDLGEAKFSGSLATARPQGLPVDPIEGLKLPGWL